MTTHTNTVIRCDRCGLKKEVSEHYDIMDWYIIGCVPYNDYHKGYGPQKDLCKECKESYDKWWSHGE